MLQKTLYALLILTHVGIHAQYPKYLQKNKVIDPCRRDLQPHAEMRNKMKTMALQYAGQIPYQVPENKVLDGMLKQIFKANNPQLPTHETVIKDFLNPQNNGLETDRNLQQLKRQQEMAQLMGDLEEERKMPKTKPHPLEKKLRLADTNSLMFKQKAPEYEASYRALASMLQGRDSLDLKRAIWLSERPYHRMGYANFERMVKEAVTVVNHTLKKERLDAKNPMHVHQALRKLYRDTSYIHDAKTKLSRSFMPYTYDFNDPFGKRDMYRYSVAKLLQTHKGQCHSLPLLYMILAQELHVEAYMSYTPMHSFIQFREEGQLKNFETTNGHLATRDYYASSGFIKSEAIANRIYLYTVHKKQLLATLLVDLASYYQRDLGYSGFMVHCTMTCQDHFPNHIPALILYENCITAFTMDEARKAGYPPATERYKYPKLREMLDYIDKVQALVDGSGYEPIPEKTYHDWLNPKKK